MRWLGMTTALVAVLAAAAGSWRSAWAAEADRAAPAEIREWTVKFVTAYTKRPLAGLTIDANVAVPGESELQKRTLVADAEGVVRFPMFKGQATGFRIRTPSRCFAAGYPLVGDINAELLGKDAKPRDPAKTVTIGLYRGVEVRGRLLLPDGKPARGVVLHAGVHCNQEPWISKQYLENRMTHSYSVSEWPNWNSSTTTEADGTFSVTVPPANVRGWVRLGTTNGGYGAVDTAALEQRDPDHALVRFAPLSIDFNGGKETRQVKEADGVLDVGDLPLEAGIVLRGRVVDAQGEPLEGVVLHTSGKHGPFAGRKAISQADGSFAFRPMAASTFTLKPDAHFRDEKGEQISREVQAVFVDREVVLDAARGDVELEVRALPHVELEFEWVDRRAAKGQPIAYYGAFTLTGQVPRDDGSRTYWRGETVLKAREGREVLTVKVPANIVGLKIALHPDQKVTPSYREDGAEQLTTGNIDLGDPARAARRMIYGDEPLIRP